MPQSLACAVIQSPVTVCCLSVCPLEPDTEGERDYMTSMIKIIAIQVTAILLLVPCTLKGRGISILLLQVLFYIFMHHEYHYTNLHKPAHTYAHTLALKACIYHTNADSHTALTHTHTHTHTDVHTAPIHPPTPILELKFTV